MLERLLVTSMCVMAALASPANAQEPVRAITKISGDLYRFQDNQHYGLFLVTSEGIVVCDPLNVGAANWLAAELEERFDVPVKYVLYSHHHFDHASGAAAFAETAEIVSHANTPKNLEPPAVDAPLSAQAASIDANKDGKLQQSELPPFMAAGFGAMDTDKSGTLSGREVFVGAYRNVLAPTRTFTDTERIEIGGKVIELVHVPGAHADDMAYIYFPAEKVLFGVDVITAKRLPNSLAGYDPKAQARYRDAALAIPFETLSPGHGALGSREDVAAYFEYMEEVAAGVREGIARGDSLAQIQETLTLKKYADWENFETARPQNIASMYALLTRSE